MGVRRGRKAVSVVFVASIASAGIVSLPNDDVAQASGPLSNGATSTTMVSTLANGTSVPTIPANFGASEVAVSEDGKVVAFTSDVPAEELVTDPLQTGHVHDNNTGVNFGAISAGLDVFVYDSRVPSPLGPIVSLVSWNSSHTGTGNGPADSPVMAPLGVGLVFRSSATDLTTGAVDNAFQQHLYAWVPIASDLMGVFLVDNKLGTHDACDCISFDPSISLFPPTVVFLSNGNDMVAPGFNMGGGNQVFANDVISGTTTVVSKDVNGNGVAGGADAPMIAAHAPIVVFTSSGNDLTAGFTPIGTNVWVRNLITQTTTLVSTDKGGGTHGTTGNHDPVISQLGNGVAWSSNDPNVTLTPFTNLDHIFYRAIEPVTLSTVGPTFMVDTDWTGAVGCDQNSNNPGISGDGLAVVFESNCSDIVSPLSPVTPLTDFNGHTTDVFIRHYLPLGLPLDVAPVLVSINDLGTGTGQSGSQLCAGGGTFETACASLTNPSVTVNADGTAVAFVTTANDIATPPLPPPPFILGNIVIGYPSPALPGFPHPATVTASVSVLGHNPAGSSGVQVISADGGSVAYVSCADDLVAGDTNGKGDVFLTDIHNSFVIQPVSAVQENVASGNVTITLHRSGNLGTTDTIAYETGDGSTPDLPLLPDEIKNPANSNATQPGDYTQTTGSLTFPPGVATKTFNVPITNDATAESPEIFHVAISSKSGAGSVALPGPLSEAYVVILDDDAPPQNWHVNVSTPPPATAQVGDTVTVGYTVSVDVGTQNLSVTSVGSGAGTTGLDNALFPLPPTTVVAGTTSAESLATARVVAVPGSPGVHLQLSVDGSLGAVAGTRTADMSTIVVGEAVTATLGQTTATPALTDQITYTLTVTNGSDTAAQLSGLPAGFVAPAGTTLANEVDGPPTVAANGTSVWTLTVDVDDADGDGSMITQTPTAMYAMSAVSLPARSIAITPPAVMATVAAPAITVGPHTLNDVNGGTLDPGDQVDVSITVSNNGGGDVTSATLADTLTDLTSPTNVQVDGVACVACTTASSVTAPLGSIASNAATVVTFSAQIPASPAGTSALSSASVAFAPATTGTSPTTADVASLTIGSQNAPTVEITKKSGQADPTNGSSIHFTVTFSEPVTGFADGDVNLSASTAGAGLVSTVTGGPTVYDVSVTGMSMSGNVIGSVDAAVAKDADNNDNVPSAASATVAYDVTPPTVSITKQVGQADPTNVSPILYTVVFSEPVSDFATGDVGLGLSTTGSTTADVTGSGTTYTVAVSGMTHSGVESPRIAASVASDAAGNANAMGTVGADGDVAWDVDGPTVAVNQAAAQGDPTSASTIMFTVVFSQTVTGFTEADVQLGGGGNPTAVVVTGSGATYTLSVSGMNQSGTVTAAVKAGAVTDDLGNPSAASTSIDNSVQFTLPAQISIGDAIVTEGAANNHTTISMTNPNGATCAVKVTSTDGSATSPADFAALTADPFTLDQVPSVDVPISVVDDPTDDHDEYFTAKITLDAAASDPNCVIVDDTATILVADNDPGANTPPSVTIAAASGQADPTIVSPVKFTVTFNEAVIGFDETDVDLTQSTSDGSFATTVTGGPFVYDVSVDVTGATTTGTVAAQIPAGAATSGVQANFASNTASVSFVVDHVKPTVTITKANGQADPSNGLQANFTVTFSENVTDFDDLTDVSLTGSTASGAVVSAITGGPMIYNVLVSGIADSGIVQVTVLADVAVDVGNNLNVAAPAPATVLFDKTGPTPTIDLAPGQGDPSSDASIDFSVTFDEPVTGFQTGDVVVSGTAGAGMTAGVSGSGTDYTVSVTGMTQSGTVKVALPFGAAVDALSNPSTNVANVLDDTVQFILKPTVTINQGATQNDPTTISPVVFDVTFSQVVNDFTAGDVTLTGTAGATTASVTGSGKNYTVSVTGMNQVGTVVATIAAGVAHNASNDANIASTSTDNTVQFNSPVIGVSTPGGTVTVTVTSGGLLSSAGTSALQVPAPNGVTFPFGQLNFTATGPAGGLVTFQLQLPSAVTEYYKLVSNAWQKFTFDGETGAVISNGGTTINVTVKDNLRGDSDATSGIYTDPAAPAVLAQVPTTTTTAPTTSPTTAPGALPPTGSSSTNNLIVLASLLVGIGCLLAGARRRQSKSAKA